MDIDELNEQVSSSRPLLDEDRVVVGGGRANQIRMSSEISSKEALDLQAVGSMSREWTNEKHSLYLDSMEASFVRQLRNHEYHSMDMLGQHSRLDNLLDPNMSSRTNADGLKPSNQFKMLQSGCWKKINFGTAQPKTNTADDSRLLLENQWIRHFRRAGKHQERASPNLQEDGAQSSESIYSGGQKSDYCGSEDRQKAASHGAKMCSKKLRVGFSHQRDLAYVSIDTEVSDQNFIEESNEEKHISNHFKAKKMKTATGDVLNKDQVVPLRIFSTVVDCNASHASPGKESVVHNEQQSEDTEVTTFP